MARHGALSSSAAAALRHHKSTTTRSRLAKARVHHPGLDRLVIAQRCNAANLGTSTSSAVTSGGRRPHRCLDTGHKPDLSRQPVVPPLRRTFSVDVVATMAAPCRTLAAVLDGSMLNQLVARLRFWLNKRESITIHRHQRLVGKKSRYSFVSRSVR